MSSPQDKQTQDEISARIVKAAADHFVDDGYAGTSTAAIAASAKTSKREIYRRFGNKEALFQEVMVYLCGLVEDDEATQPQDIAAGLKQIAQSVIARFMQTKTRGVLVSAIAASSKFPEIPELFWSTGPGRAVDAAAELLVSPLATQQGLKVAKPQKSAHDYILKCCGPFVLDYLIDPQRRPTKKQIDQHFDDVTRQLLAAHSK